MWKMECEGSELSSACRQALENELRIKCMGGTGPGQPRVEQIIVRYSIAEPKPAWGLSGHVRILPDSPLTGGRGSGDPNGC